eukprot:gene32148-16678_t
MPKAPKRKTILQKAKYIHPEAPPKPKHPSTDSNGEKKKKPTQKINNPKSIANGIGGGKVAVAKPAVRQQLSAPSEPGSEVAPADGTPRLLFANNVINRQAAYALEKLVEGGKGAASIKSLTLGPKVVEKKATHAVTCQVLKYELLHLYGANVKLTTKLREMMAAAGVKNATDLQPKSARNGFDGLPHPRTARVNTLKDVSVEDNATDLLPKSVRNGFDGVPHPRTARVNTLKNVSVEDVLALLQDPPAEWEPKYRSNKLGGIVKVDSLLPDVLTFPHGTDIHDHPLVLSGSLILQSKASCMPAHALKPDPSWTVVDCCAAPGNKTTHVAALLGGKDGGSVFAFDKDSKRLARLKENVKKAGASDIITATNADFLTIDPTSADFAKVCGVILDPSCSGSGTVYTRMDHLIKPALESKNEKVDEEDEADSERVLKLAQFQILHVIDRLIKAAAETENERGREEDEADSERVLKLAQFQAAAETGNGKGEEEDEANRERVLQLAQFQEAALRHALTFPALKRLVYSTCSVYARENENVVAAVLEEAAEKGFELVDPFPAWPRRGEPLFEGAENLIRTDPHLDGTDGFFVAVFERCDGTMKATGKRKAPVNKPKPKFWKKEKKQKTEAVAEA